MKESVSALFSPILFLEKSNCWKFNCLSWFNSEESDSTPFSPTIVSFWKYNFREFRFVSCLQIENRVSTTFSSIIYYLCLITESLDVWADLKSIEVNSLIINFVT